MRRLLGVGQIGCVASLPDLGYLNFHPRIEMVYQINFSANCICLDDVVVGAVNRPATAFTVPSGFKTLRFALFGGL
jgi:hypothetical protein